MKNLLTHIIVIIVTLLIGINGTIYFYNMNEDTEETINQNVNITATDTYSPIVDKVHDAVMTIMVTTNQGTSLGTGFVYKTDENYGYLLTNNHVIDNYKEIEVSNNNSETETAELLGSDELSDLAVIRVPKSIVTTVAELGASTDIKVGDHVLAIGTPIDEIYYGSVSNGIISGLDRKVTVDLTDGSEFIMDVIQITAAINPGNSGGPLINTNGEVIGINTLKLVEDEIEGMGFAIPIEMAISILDKLENGEEIQKPLLGISLIDANNDYALANYNIELDKIYSSGIVIIDVNNNSTAEKYGLEKNDIILKINGVSIEDSVHFKYILYKYNIGETIEIELDRNGKTETISLTLENSL